MTSTGTITVAVRVRPPTSWEAARLPEPPSFDSALRGDGTLSSPRKGVTSSNVRDIIEIADDRILTFDPPDRDAARAFSERGFLPPGTKRYKDRRFMFDRVFDGHSHQMEVYENTARPLLDGLLDGYNSTVFAYGATGCGKTYTISGVENDPGLIYLAMADLFQRIEDRKDETNFEVAVTFLEIYNEEIRDLLVDAGTSRPKGGLAIREDKAVKVVNLTELKPNNAREVSEIVRQGNERRTQSPTHANETSSRSHAALQVHVTQAPRTASTTEMRTMATLSIIDLAGSERASATKNMGERMVEGANINKSLLALGNCINALCESGGTTRHIPYRNSKLTRLLKFSLGGNCKTVMIVCIAPTSIHFEDTHNALVYAERATKIKTKVVTRNVLNVNRHVGQYVEAINRLNEEVAQLKAKLAGKSSGEEEMAKRKRIEAIDEVNRAKGDIRTKTELNKAVITDGALCQGNVDLLQVKISSLSVRMDAIDKSLTIEDSLDLRTERSLLQSMIDDYETALQNNSPLNLRIAKAKNAESLFDATLRAVTERRTGRLDEISVENIKSEAKMQRAEMEQFKVEAQNQAFRDAIAQQTRLVSNLVGVVARCTSVMRSGCSMLESLSASDLGDAIQPVRSALLNAASANESAFGELLGQSLSPQAHLPRSLTRHSISKWADPLHTTGQTRTKSSRRSSAIAASPRKVHMHSPRKGARLSLSKPKRHEKRLLEAEKKVVRWKDEENSMSTLIDKLPSSCEESLSIPRTSVTAASESDWEDEKTDDSVHFNVSSTTSRRNSLSQKRLRSNRLDPTYLKSKATPLESLKEDETRRVFSDRINRLPSSSSSEDSNTKPIGSKVRGIGGERRQPSAQLFSRSTSRRISAIGPMRSSRSRRRSSALMDSVPINENIHHGPRRVALGLGSSSPSQRVKRSSGPKLAVPVELNNDTSFKSSKRTWR